MGKMQEKYAFFTFLLLCAPIHGNSLYGSFLEEYFSDKQCTITMHLCWTFGDILKMLRANHDSKQIAIFRNNKNMFHFLDHLATDNIFVLDMNDCESSWRILDDVNGFLEFRWPLKFVLLVDEDNFESRLKEKVNSYNILPSSDVLVAKRLETGDFVLLKPYRISKNDDAVWEDFGFWNSTFQRSAKLKHLSDRRHDLNRINMNVGLLFDSNDTWNHLEDYKYPRVDTFTKQNFATIKALIEYCNINMTIVPADVWGYYNETTDDWSGLVGSVKNNEVQISGSSPFFTAQRFQVVDFIKMQNPLTIQFVMKRPPVSSVYNLFTLPFNANVWRCLGITVVIFIVAIYIAYNWESRTNMTFSDKGRFSFSDVILVISEVMCQQGTLTVPESTPSRILVLFLFTAFMFIYSSYSAYITVVLQSTFKISSYHTLIDSQMRVGAMNTSYMPYYVSQSESKIEAELYKRKIGPKGYYSLEEGMKKVKDGFFAFHCEVAAAFDYISKNFDEHETCRIQTLYGYTEHMHGYTMVPKNSAYKKIFKVGLMRIEEYGIQKRNYHRYFRTPKCFAEGGEFQSVGLLETFSAFLTLIVGSSISFILWMVEVVRYRRANRKANQEIERSTKGERNHPQVSALSEVWS